MTPVIQRGLISVLVPFRAADNQRQELWDWLEQYWSWELPGAEILVGTNTAEPFCKTCAVNQAAARAHGDIIVILDADCLIDGEVVERCARRIRQSERLDVPLWFIPYRHIYRLTDAATQQVLASSPRHPLQFSSPPPLVDVESTLGSGFGHRFGALIQIMSHAAFNLVGGMDPRFSGWGGEDIAFVRAVDTLYGPHKTTDNDVLHLWHSKIGKDFKDRMWQGQDKPRNNDRLAMAYHTATGSPLAMRALVDAGFQKEG